MTVETLVAFVSVILAVVFQYLPKLKDEYGKLADNYQRLVMLGLLVLVVGGAYGMSCAKYGDYFTCDKEGWIAAIKLLLLSVIYNQGFYKILPNPNKRDWKP